MSQQINLLVREKPVNASTMLAFALWGLILLMLAALWAVRQREVSTARAAETASAQALQAGQAQLQARIEQTGGNLASQIEALRPRAEAAQRLLAQVHSMGSPEGYSRYFTALAATSEDGVWLTNVDIHANGNSVTLNGRALREEAVVHYAQRLNAQFANYGVQFSAVDMTPTTAAAPGGGPPLAAMSFKLYR